MSNSSPTILMLVPYFGRWPKWLRFYLETCRWNPTISWLLISDCGTPEDLPPNVGFKAISFADYKAQISAALGIDTRHLTPYKLCDIRPAMGVIHSDVIAPYDYWGYGDIDVIYGDIRSIYTPDIFTYDVISTHHHMVSGHFTLIRNSARLANAFRRVRGWRRLLESPRPRRFDERYFSNMFSSPYRLWRRLRSPFLGGALLVERNSTVAKIIGPDGSADYAKEWYWREGRLTNDRQSDRGFLYFHFMDWQSNRWTKAPIAPWQCLTTLDHLAPERFTKFRVNREGFMPLQ